MRSLNVVLTAAHYAGADASNLTKEHDMSRESLAQIMRNVQNAATTPRPRRVANNTVEYYNTAGDRVIRLHQTDILTFFAPDFTRCAYTTGGWQTVTTKDRFNSLGPVRVYSDKGLWYFGGCKDTPFYEGAEVRLYKGAWTAPRSATAETKNRKLAANIKRFVDRLDKLDVLPQPSGGDCWFCSMFDRAGEPGRDDLGRIERRKTHDASHLLQHIKEGYMHGALILNALRWTGLQPAGISLYWNDFGRKDGSGRRTVKSALRRYLRFQLGLPT